MAIDPKININENQVIFKRDKGHLHDGLTSSLIDYTKYSVFDFAVYPVAPSGTSRRNLEEANSNNLKTFIVNTIEERVLNPQGIRIQANAITAREIVSGTITANELSSNVVLVNNVIKSKNYNGTVDINGNITSYGNAGWAITHSGSSEFNNVFVRGGISANTGTIGGIVITGSSLYSSDYDGSNGFALYSNGFADFNEVSVRGEIIATSGSIADNFVIGNNITIGNAITIGSNASIQNNLTIGNNVRINGAAGDGAQSIVKIRADDSGANPNNYPLNVVSYLNNLAFRVTYNGDCRVGNDLRVDGDITYVGTITDISDIRLKSNIEKNSLGLDFVKELNPVTYSITHKGENKHHGFIAQEVKDIFEKQNIEFHGWKKIDGYDNLIEGGEIEVLDYVQFIPVLVNAIKELANNNTLLEARLQALEGV